MAEVNSALWADYIPQAERAEKKETTETTKRSNDELDKNSFLMLLITQMRYQDPLNPVEDKEFVAQMAQFSALEQMQNMNATMTSAQSYSMIGKYVIADTYNQETGEYTTVGGLVESVTIKNKEPFLYVDGNEIRADEVTDVTNDPYLAKLAAAQSANAFMAQNIAMIGKYVQAITYDSEGKATGFVEGRVDNVKLVDGQPVLVVGNKDIYPTELISVSNENDMILTGKTVKVPTKDSDGNDVYQDLIIRGVDVTGEIAKLITDTSDIEIDKIDAVGEALKCIGQTVTIKTETDPVKVTGVTIDDRIPYLLTEDGQKVKFSSVIR
ncbi:MAG: hypothetical protein LBU77_06110 [Clostridiales bacterium]|jgi:flagellar basal-body rod modification protein FlgD|nr:hypothetical protein [Clostridiales bacterium]